MSFAQGRAASKTDRLRKGVAEAGSEREHLVALLALARHFAELSDGANGLEAARAAREIAIRLGEWDAVTHALNSASVSQYHRSDYAAALATAIDAWDAAQLGGSPLALAESLYTVGLALHSLGETGNGLRIVEKGLALTECAQDLREPQVRLIGLKAMLLHRLGRFAESEACCARAVELARDLSLHLRELGHGNWGLALLRTAEQHLECGEPAGELLERSREQLAEALRLAIDQDDVMRIADRLSSLGQVAWVAGRPEEARQLLEDALRRSVELDYVRTAVISTRYLARLHLANADFARAVEVLRVADAMARRGAPMDSRPAVKLMLAEALEGAGQAIEAERARLSALAIRIEDDDHRRNAVGQARRLADRILDERKSP
jgi:tetratricopeptide (TPR) repeat protein